MTKKIAFLTYGNGHQIRSFHDFAAYLDDMLYVPELDQVDLSQYAAVVVPDGMDSEVIRPHAAALDAYVQGGGFLVVFNARVLAPLLTAIKAELLPIPSKDWLWWTKPGTKLEIYQPEPRHPICDVIPLRDMGWHWHEALALTEEAQSVLNVDGDSGSLILDYNKLPNTGRVFLTVLAPHVHNGERFMPATTRFLNAFYIWLNRELGIDRRPQGFTFTYLQSIHRPTEWRPPELEKSIIDAGGTAHFVELYDLSAGTLAGTDILYIPNNTDQFFLRKQQQVLLDHLARGKHLIISSEPAIAWLPFLDTFKSVPPRPYTNIKVRVRHDPFGFFKNMDEDFSAWSGVFGQYARGWTEIPKGGVWLTDVGTADDPRPADWLWQFPTDNGKGGYVVMHNGDNMMRYPDHGVGKDGLVRDVCLGLMNAGLVLRDPTVAPLPVAPY